MTEFNDSDFDGLLFNVHKHPPTDGVSYIEIFPQIRMYEEFLVPLPDDYDRNQVISYIVLTYDRTSPLRKKYTDIGERKNAALRMSEFPLRDGKFSKYVEYMAEGKVPEINEMIILYIKLHFNTKFTLLTTTEAIFYNMLKKAVGGDLGTKATEITAIENILLDTQKALLAGDNSVNLVENLYRKTNSVKKVDYSPEEVSKRIRDDGYSQALTDKFEEN